jgi:hypothetical protein
MRLRCPAKVCGCQQMPLGSKPVYSVFICGDSVAMDVIAPARGMDGSALSGDISFASFGEWYCTLRRF